MRQERGSRRHDIGPHRAIQTGVGPVEVRRAKVRDRGEVGTEEKIRFTSSILPKWARRTKSLDALLPVLYLRGVSVGDFQEALAALLGKDAPNLSPAVISRLTAEWQADYDAWQKRDLSARRYVYVWADGVYLQARMEDNAECPALFRGEDGGGENSIGICALPSGSALSPSAAAREVEGERGRHGLLRWRSSRSMHRCVEQFFHHNPTVDDALVV